MSQFHEYPKMLIHPAGQSAQIGFEPMQGRPATFPPVEVHNADQEESYKAKGYVALGSSDAEAYERVKSGGLPPHYRFEEYPKFITVDQEEILVHSKSEEHQLLGYSPAQTAVRNKPGRKPKSEAAVAR